MIIKLVELVDLQLVEVQKIPYDWEFNINKYSQIIFIVNKKPYMPNYFTNDSQLNVVDTVKDLGVLVDYKVPHRDMIISTNKAEETYLVGLLFLSKI